MTGTWQAVSALYWRRLRLTFRNKYLIVTRVTQPILWLAVLGPTFNNMLQGTRPTPGGIDYLSFMGAGAVAMILIFTALFGGMSLVWDREFGVLKEFLAAPIPRMAIPVGNAFSVATEGLLQSLIIMVVGLLIGAKFALSPMSLLGYVAISILICLILYGLAASIAVNLKNTQAFMAVMTFLTMPLFFVSGAIYPLQFMPQGLQQIAAASPVTHSVALVRYFLLGEKFSNLEGIWAPMGFSASGIDALLSFAYLLILGVISMGCASFLFRRTTTE